MASGAQRPFRRLAVVGAPVSMTGLALGLGLALGFNTGCIRPPGQQADDQANTQAGAGSSDKPTGPKRQATVPADGWNDDIAWRSLEEGLAEAKQSKMPVMMVVHTSWCGNCQKLKRTFNGDDKLAALSEQFVMVHVDQDAQPDVTLYGPDGQYIPRVMFLDADGNIDQGLQNPNRPSKFRYFYTPQEDLVATMRQALDRYGNNS